MRELSGEKRVMKSYVASPRPYFINKGMMARVGHAREWTCGTILKNACIPLVAKERWVDQGEVVTTECKNEENPQLDDSYNEQRPKSPSPDSDMTRVVVPIMLGLIFITHFQITVTSIITQY